MMMTLDKHLPKDEFYNLYNNNPFVKGLIYALYKNKCFMCRYKMKKISVGEMLFHLFSTHGLPIELFYE